MKVYYEVYGCAVMLGEAKRALEDLKARGHELTDNPDEADVRVLFTCTVRSETEQRMLARIENLRKFGRVVVAGCLASAQPGLVKMYFPDVSVVHNESLHLLHLAVEGKAKYLFGHKRPRDWFSSRAPSGKTLVVPVADGCLGNCTFCITKAARPELRSQKVEAIVEYVKEGVRKGAKEVWLTAPDLAAYGRDIGKDLVDLLEAVLKALPEDVKVRVGMMSPDTFAEIADRLIDVMRDERVYKFFHLPLQSASDKVLKLMGRRYTYEEYKKLVEKVRRVFEDPMIATDVLVGFPGEEEEDFRATLNALRELAFERVHLAAYTPRPLTIGARMRQVREYVKAERVRRAMRVVEEVGLETHKRYVGGKFLARVSEFDEKHKTYVARLHNYVPVVLDGEAEVGEDVVVEVRDATFYDLRGSILSRP